MFILTPLFLEGRFWEGQSSIFVIEFQEYLAGVHVSKDVGSLWTGSASKSTLNWESTAKYLKVKALFQIRHGESQMFQYGNIAAKVTAGTWVCCPPRLACLHTLPFDLMVLPSVISVVLLHQCSWAHAILPWASLWQIFARPIVILTWICILVILLIANWPWISNATFSSSRLYSSKWEISASISTCKMHSWWAVLWHVAVTF